ncbi:MAG: cell division protein FtsA [Nitrospirae bacterium 13_2_20CM_2_63_8]|nr:MAG: cell division protein FtsA [Nitrospirae bacterium 13_2_20CM_2_63_8]
MARKDQIIVGLDIGTTKTRAIVAEAREDGKAHVIGVGTSLSRGLRKGVVVNIESTVESIRRAVDEAEMKSGTQINSVYVGIAGSHIKGLNSEAAVVVKSGEVVRSDITRSIKAARAAAIVTPDHRVLHVLPRGFILDQQDGIRDPLAMSGAHLKVNVHIITGAVTAIQNLVKSVERAELDVIGIILQPLASSEAVLTDDERELGVAMVDLGGGTTDLAIFAEGGVMHTAVIPVGGTHFTNDIAIGLKTPMPDAERIKTQFGCAMASLVKDDELIDVPSMGGRPSRSLSRRVLADVIEPRAEEVFDLVAREIKRAGYEGIVAGGVVITGGTSLMEGMPDMAERVLDLPARRGYPWGVGGIREQVDNPMYATGVGLILHALHHQDDLALNGRRGRRGLWRTVDNMKGWFREFF